MRQGLVIGNWKMHGSVSSTEALLSELITLTDGAAAEIAVCPPAVYVPLALQITAASALSVGAQNCSQFESGAYTGEVSAVMLAELGCDRVILGHSERRQYFGETSESVAAKCTAVQAAGLVPIVCVGETLEQREQGAAKDIVAGQLQAVVDAGLRASDVIAYEPVWAIGTGLSASPEQAQEMHAFIRDFLRAAVGDTADSMRLLYGGSVKAANAAELFGQQDIDGGLVGGAALDAQEFSAIVMAA